MFARPYPATVVQTLGNLSVASAVPGYGRHLSLGLARSYPGTAVQTLRILIVASAVPGYGCANTWKFDCCVCMFPSVTWTCTTVPGYGRANT